MISKFLFSDHYDACRIVSEWRLPPAPAPSRTLRTELRNAVDALAKSWWTSDGLSRTFIELIAHAGTAVSTAPSPIDGRVIQPKAIFLKCAETVNYHEFNAADTASGLSCSIIIDHLQPVQPPSSLILSIGPRTQTAIWLSWGLKNTRCFLDNIGVAG
jgi:hypothetical protein